jgi:hypothetical protein
MQLPMDRSASNGFYTTVVAVSNWLVFFNPVDGLAA